MKDSKKQETSTRIGKVPMRVDVSSKNEKDTNQGVARPMTTGPLTDSMRIALVMRGVSDEAL